MTTSAVLDAGSLSGLASSSGGWSFAGQAVRATSDVYFQYPAMMVPAMQRQILSHLRQDPRVKVVIDPFVGSGTMLSESMAVGLDFIGIDINPLAVLLCQVKAGPYYPSALEEKAKQLKRFVEADRSNRIETDLPNRDKWFTKPVQIRLSRLRRAIALDPAPWARRFFWAALAETVRLCSNSRTSTYKLHIRSKEDLSSRKVEATAVFFSILRRNTTIYSATTKRLTEIGRLRSGHYQGDTEIRLGDIRNQTGLSGDVVITSPPYGDNHTTVPYGQSAYLPLHWIDLEDVDAKAERHLVSTHEIDYRSLGGSRSISVEEVEVLTSRSPSLGRFLERVPRRDLSRLNHVSAFVRDLDNSLTSIMTMLDGNGHLVWTVGNRKVLGRRVPLDLILTELLSDMGADLVDTISRSIPGTRKRMPRRNGVDTTIRKESVLVFQKRDG